MAKTKTLGIRTTPQLINELEELKKAFDFDSYSDMLSCLAHLLKSVDQRICQIQDHPRTWTLDDIRNYLPLHPEDGNAIGEELSQLVWRRLKQRFGEDGVEALQRKLGSTS